MLGYGLKYDDGSQHAHLSSLNSPPVLDQGATLEDTSAPRLAGVLDNHERRTNVGVSAQVGPGEVGLSDRHPRRQGVMRGLARWCMAHRRRVIVGWLAVAVLASVLSHAIGPSYSSVFGIPGTESQRARELLKREFPAQSGDADTIVFHVAHGTIDLPEVRAAILPLLARVQKLPHVAGIVSPYSSAGAVQVSANRMTAFATVNYDKQANLLSNNTGKSLLADVKPSK